MHSLSVIALTLQVETPWTCERCQERPPGKLVTLEQLGGESSVPVLVAGAPRACRNGSPRCGCNSPTDSPGSMRGARPLVLSLSKERPRAHRSFRPQASPAQRYVRSRASPSGWWLRSSSMAAVADYPWCWSWWGSSRRVTWTSPPGHDRPDRPICGTISTLLLGLMQLGYSHCLAD
jgi:hypothetical protein